MKTPIDIHSCSYWCTRPACVLQQRDALRERLSATDESLREFRKRAERAEAERDALRALLREAREDWIKVGYGASHEDVAACRDVCDRIDAFLAEKKP